MRDKLVRHERVKAVQEALVGFILEQIVNKDDKFYYNGGNLDNRAQY
jgi:hypothetical protein